MQTGGTFLAHGVRAAANDDYVSTWGDEWDELRVAITPDASARLMAACGGVTVVTLGWSDAHVDRFLHLFGAGYDRRDAAAIVNGDAVLEDGRVDYDPGCSWIDSALCGNASA